MKNYIESQSTGYQAKIQIRPSNQEVYTFVKNELKKDNVLIVNQFQLKEGIDLLVNSSKSAFALGKKFKRKFKGEVKITRKLFTLNKQSSKKVYRLTVLLRLKEEEPL